MALARGFRLGLVVALANLLVIGAAAGSEPLRVSSERPTIGLVLSGGGARGAAHIGVLQVLEELQVPIDFVVGTSMGSIVGGLYASGADGERLEEIVTGVDWARTLSNDRPRQALPFRRREDDRAFRFRGVLRLENGRPQIPAGVVDGRHVLYLLRGLTLGVSQVESFDDLPIPFRAVASDLRTGESVVLASGDLALAMRASMSAPGFFDPIELDGHLLADGGITANLPIEVARTLAPDILIAVDVGDTLYPLEADSSVLAVFNQMLTILIGRQSAQEAATLGPEDLLITPDLDGLGSTEFDRAAAGIQAGRRAAEALSDSLRQLAVPSEDYAAYRRELQRVSTSPRVAEILLPNETEENADRLRRSLGTEVGAALDLEELAADLEYLDALELLDPAGTRFEAGDDETVSISIATRSITDRSETLRFHLALDDDFQGETRFELGLRYVATRVGQAGAELRIDTILGEQQSFGGEWYQPTGPRFFVAPRAAYRARRVPILTGDGRPAIYRLRGWSGGFDVGMEILRGGELRLGYSYWNGDAERQTGAPSPLTESFSQQQARLLLRFDTLDHASFPGRGQWFEAMAVRQFEGLATPDPIDFLDLRWSRAFSPGRFRGSVSAELGLLFDPSTPAAAPFALGGPHRLSAMTELQLVGRQKALITAQLLYPVADRGFSMPIYLGGTVETGNIWSERREIDLSDLLWHGSVFLAVDSYLGPAQFGIGFGEDLRRRYFFSLGHRF